jgi:hypothetical protein
MTDGAFLSVSEVNDAGDNERATLPGLLKKLQQI